MDIKMIMSDIDGTLIGGKYRVATPRTIKAIQRCKEKGILFGLATGRPIESCENSLKKWGIEKLVDVIVGINGGYIKDYTLQTEKAFHQLEGQYIKEIMEHFKEFDVTFCVYKDGIMFADREDEWVINLSTSDKMPLQVVDKEVLYQEAQSKLIIVCNPKYMQAIQAKSDSFTSSQYRGFQTGDDLFEYMDPSISKSEGIHYVLEKHNLNIDQLLTFGDANNDYEMTRDSGVGVVMKNGSELTKSVADYICDDCDNDGIGKFIEEYILK